MVRPSRSRCDHEGRGARHYPVCGVWPTAECFTVPTSGQDASLQSHIWSKPRLHGSSEWHLVRVHGGPRWPAEGISGVLRLQCCRCVNLTKKTTLFEWTTKDFSCCLSISPNTHRPRGIQVVWYFVNIMMTMPINSGVLKTTIVKSFIQINLIWSKSTRSSLISFTFYIWLTQHRRWSMRICPFQAFCWNREKFSRSTVQSLRPTSFTSIGIFRAKRYSCVSDCHCHWTFMFGPVFV